jgi:hypothetical protein
VIHAPLTVNHRDQVTAAHRDGHYRRACPNLRAAVKDLLDSVADAAAAPVIKKYTGVLGAVDVFTVPTAFSILESIRLDLGYRMDVHP